MSAIRGAAFRPFTRPSSTPWKPVGSLKARITRIRRIHAVESRKGAVSLARPVSPPRSSNRTCGFPASGFPTGFTTGSRQDALPPTLTQPRHPKRAKHCCHCERPDASRRHLVAPDEEVAYAIIDVRLDRPVRDVMRPWAEVAAPSPQQAGQLRTHVVPSSHVARHQDGAHLIFQTLHAFIRWAG